MKLRCEILRLAGPSILANITVPLVGMADVAIAGHLDAGGGAALIGGIAVGSMLFDLLYWNFGFLRAGTAGLTAQAYGRLAMPGSDRASQAIGAILRRALRIAWLSGLALIALQWLVVWAALLVVDCSPEVRALATQYFHIRIWAAPATLSLFAFKGWFIGLQDTVRPMTADLLVNGVNIGASVLLALWLGFPGIALGTVLAQWTGFAYCLAAARRRYPALSRPLLRRPLLRPTRRRSGANTPLSAPKGTTTTSLGANTPVSAPECTSGVDSGVESALSAPEMESRRFFAVNRDLFLRSVGMIAVYIGFTVLSARYGDVMLAVSTILMKLLMFFSYFTDGFAYAGEALTGRFVGEGSREGVRATVRGCFAWGLGVMALFLAVYGLGGTPLLRLMTSDASVVSAGREFLPWLLAMPVIGCPAFIWDGIFIGATATRDLRSSTLLCAVGFFAAWFLGLWLAGGGVASALSIGPVAPETAIHILMAAYFVHLAVRALYLTLRYRPAVLHPLSTRGT